MSSTTTHATKCGPDAHDDRTLQVLLQRSLEPVIVASHFDGAGWDPAWHALEVSGWAEIERVFGDEAHYVTLETGANRELAVRYGLEIIPQVLVFVGGEVAARFMGRVRPADVIVAVRETLRSTEVRKTATQEAAQELETLRPLARERLSPVYSVVRRARSEPALALAGAG